MNGWLRGTERRGVSARGAAVGVVAVATSWGCTPFEAGDDVALAAEQAGEPTEQSNPLQALGGTSEEASSQGGGAEDEGLGLPEPWGCLDEEGLSVGMDDVREGSSEEVVTLRVRFHDFVTQEPLDSAFEARICLASDISCAEPVVDYTPLQNNGRLAALVPWGSSVYIEMQGPGVLTQAVMVDTLLYRDLELYSHAALPVAAFQGFGAVLGVNLDNTNALLSLNTRDCNGREAAGVTFEFGTAEQGVPYVIRNGLPTINVTETGPDGSFGVANFPPGLANVTAFTPDGREMDSQAVLLREGGMTFVTFRPRVYSAEEMCAPNGADIVAGTRAGFGQLVPCESL